MADDLNPTGPSQPTLSQAYTTPGNASTKNPQESSSTASTSHVNAQGTSVDHREAQDQQQQHSRSDGTPSSLGRGIHGAPAGEERKGLGEEQLGRHRELNGQQMAAPGEGRVADAVAGRDGAQSGGGGKEQDFASDLDRKKAEQKSARDTIKQEKAGNTATGGALGQQGGPANPVDNPTQGGGNYPNSSA